MIINAKVAKAVLFEEAERAARGDPISQAWRERFEKLDDLCGKIARTHIAAVGTAILAKAVDVNVDVYSLKRTRGGPRAYVARALAKDVLAANAPQLEMDIGVYGREPLNNQPYFREDRITREMPVKANARTALFYVVDLLDILDRIETPEKACEVLRTYVAVRRERYRRPGAAPDPGLVTLGELVARIERFTAASAEGGKRAQAAAAGLLAAAFGADRVRTTRVNDPDRTLPGDVGVLSEDGASWSRVLEVRDKAVSEADLHHLLGKAAVAGVPRVAILAMAARQPELDLAAVEAAAARSGIQVVVRCGWSVFAQEAAFWSDTSLAGLAATAVLEIDRQLIDLDVSGDTLVAWRALSELEEG